MGDGHDADQATSPFDLPAFGPFTNSLGRASSHSTRLAPTPPRVLPISRTRRFPFPSANWGRACGLLFNRDVTDAANFGSVDGRRGALVASAIQTATYTIANFRIGRRLPRGLSWFAEVRNLFDKKYATTTGVIENAAGLDQAQFLPGDGRSIFAGLEYRW